MKWENQLIKDLQWSNEITNREAKQRVAREIAATAKAGLWKWSPPPRKSP